MFPLLVADLNGFALAQKRVQGFAAEVFPNLQTAGEEGTVVVLDRPLPRHLCPISLALAVNDVNFHRYYSLVRTLISLPQPSVLRMSR